MQFNISTDYSCMKLPGTFAPDPDWLFDLYKDQHWILMKNFIQSVIIDYIGNQAMQCAQFLYGTCVLLCATRALLVCNFHMLHLNILTYLYTEKWK